GFRAGSHLDSHLEGSGRSGGRLSEAEHLRQPAPYWHHAAAVRWDSDDAGWCCSVWRGLSGDGRTCADRGTRSDRHDDRWTPDATSCVRLADVAADPDGLPNIAGFLPNGSTNLGAVRRDDRS